MEITTAEGLTRYLRSQDIPFNDILKSSVQLINSNSQLLPNLKMFIFELIIDRLNEFKNLKFKLVKYDNMIWDLLITIWSKFDEHELKLKNSSLRRLKLAEVMISVFTTTKNVATIDSLLKLVNLIISSSVIDFSIDESTHILRAFLDTTIDLKDDRVFEWMRILWRIYDTSALNNAKLTSKRYLNSFANTTLISLLKCCVSDLMDERVKAQLETLISRNLFRQDTRQFLVSNIESLIKGISDQDSILLNHIFGMIVAKIDEVQILQLVFILIVHHSPQLELSMLERLSNSKRTLTTEFLSTLVDEQLASKNTNKLIIYHIIDIDTSVGFKYGEKIFTKLDDESLEINSQIASRLIDAFIRAREFEAFYDIWLAAIGVQGKFFDSEEMESLVAKNLTYLSSAQLEFIIKTKIISNLTSWETFNDANLKKLITLIPFVQFAILSNDEMKIKAVERNLILILNAKVVSDNLETRKISWKLRYLLVCFFERSSNEPESIINQLSSTILEESEVQLSAKNNYVYYTLFKLRELKTFEISDAVISSYIKALKKGDDDSIEFLFKRWLVLFNHCFTKEQIASLVTILLQYNLSKIVRWQKIVNNAYLFEQSQVMVPFIDQLKQKLADKKRRSVYLDLILSIPVQCYERAVKVQMLDLVTAIALEETSLTTIQTSLQILLKLIELPTFKSKVESDWKTILKLFELSDRTPDILAQIFTTVWRHHKDHANEELHKTWIDDVYKQLHKFYKKKDAKKLRSEHYVTAVILLDSVENSDKLSSSFRDSMCSLLEVYSSDINKNGDSISWILTVLFRSKIELPLTPKLFEALKKIGSSPTLCQLDVFNLLCKLYATGFEDLIYILALFVVLSPKNHDLNVGIKLYLSRLNLQELLQGLDYLLQFYITDVDPKEWQYIAIIRLFIETFNNHKDKEHYRQLQFYTTFTLSTILSSKLQSTEVVNEILSLLNLLLIDMGWTLSQYAFELVLAIITKITIFIQGHELESSSLLYISNTQVLSSILLHHRNRLSKRHHLIMNVFSEFLECLFVKKNTVSTVAESVECGKSYERLLSNLCELANIQHSLSTNQLNSASSMLKKNLRKYLPVLLINYVRFQIRYKMQSKMRESILNGIYVVIDTLTEDEMILVNSSLDAAGKSYFKILYSDYKKHGKWQDNV